MNRSICLILLGFLSGCANYGHLTYITKLPISLRENSGIVVLENSSIWTIEDSGNENEIYQVNYKGDLLKTLEVKKSKNRDWEDLTKDEKGNIYIADFGNNDNERKNLVIYKIPNPTLEKGHKIKAEEIKFYYPEQKKFPPKKSNLLYDAEALFYQNDTLYIITRNRSKPFSGKALIYKIPAIQGTYEATYIGEFIPCLESNNCQVTSADISPDGKTVVVLGYGLLWVFTDFTLDNFTNGKMRTIDLGAETQLESVSFTDNETVLISDEDTGFAGRNLYSFNLNSKAYLLPKD
ncbi:MAG: hypothetical protein V3U92_08435 [Cellulophaga sp.]